MTKSELEQIYHLDRELKMWKGELARLRAKSLVDSPLSGTSLYRSGISDKVAQRTEREVELENRIQAKCEEIQDLCNRAVFYIMSIPDSLTRMVIYYRCVKLSSWSDVACRVGGNNTPDGVRMIYNRFFSENP